MPTEAKSRSGQPPGLKPVCAAVFCAVSAFAPVMPAHASPAAVQVATVEFASDFLAQGSSKSVDLSRFEKGNAVPPGTYEVDVFVNQNWVGRMSVQFVAREDALEAQPVFDRALLEQMGIAVARLPPAAEEALKEGRLLHVNEIAAEASVNFDFGEQRLDLDVPQAAMVRNARGYVSPEHWDSGVTAGLLGYDANVYHFSGTGMDDRTQAYVGVNAGVNVGPWRFRHQGSYQYDSTGHSRYQNLATFAQRDLTAWKSQLTIGDAFTTGELFDSVGFRGVRVQSDDRMLPDSMRGYAPTVRGVALTNARVTITQNGNVIYETTVPPGPFVIEDLYPTGYGGDLQVAVQEADGRTQTFTVPYAAVPLSLRPGVNRFSAVAGQLRDTRLADDPLFIQATWQRGVTNLITAYGGLTAAPGYGAAILGGVLNTSFGAFGLDATEALTNVSNGRRFSGTSLRATYSKLFNATGTNFSLAAYRYSTSGYFNLIDAMTMRERPYGDTLYRARNQAQITLNQGLGDRWGQVYATGSVVDYWNQRGSDINYSVGYNNHIRNVSFNLSANRQRSGSTGAMSTLYFANVSIPVGNTHPLSVTGNVSHSSDGRTLAQSTVAGSLGVDNALSYSVTAGHASGGDTSASTSGSATLAWRTPKATVSSSVSAGSGYTQTGLALRGSVVAHPGGVTFGQPISDTLAVVEAKDADGARVLNAAGVRVDGSGYAVLPYMTPYALNTVTLDPKGLSTDVELQTTSQQVAPRAGSVTLLKFATVSGRTAIVKARRADGAPLPFGASVIDEAGKELGVVGQASRIVARGLNDRGLLTVKWGEGPADLCRIAYALPAREKGRKADSYQQVEAVCEAAGAALTAATAGPAAQAAGAAPAN